MYVVDGSDIRICEKIGGGAGIAPALAAKVIRAGRGEDGAGLERELPLVIAAAAERGATGCAEIDDGPRKRPDARGDGLGLGRSFRADGGR